MTDGFVAKIYARPKIETDSKEADIESWSSVGYKSPTYTREKSNWYVISGNTADGENSYYVREYITSDKVTTLQIDMPRTGSFGDVVKRMSRSMKPAAEPDGAPSSAKSTPVERYQGTSGQVEYEIDWPVVILWTGTVCGIGFAGAIFFKNNQDRKANAKLAAQRVAAVIVEHLPALIRRRAQLVTVDAYGTKKSEKWLAEIQYFIDTQIRPSWDPREPFTAEERAKLVSAIYLKVEAEADNSQANLTTWDMSDMSPLEFEAYCAAELSGRGGKPL